MKNTFQKIWPVAAALLLGLGLSSLVEAQTPNADPFYPRANQREARLAYLASQRAKASVPVNYSFPVRADAATAYNASAYSPRYQFSMRPNYVFANPAGAYSPAPNSYGNYAYRPQASPYHMDGRLCPLANRTVTTPPSSYYRGTIPNRSYTSASPYAPSHDPYYYVGASAAGPPKVYPKDEPVRNFFRYLFP